MKALERADKNMAAIPSPKTVFISLGVSIFRPYICEDCGEGHRPTDGEDDHAVKDGDHEREDLHMRTPKQGRPQHVAAAERQEQVEDNLDDVALAKVRGHWRGRGVQGLLDVGLAVHLDAVAFDLAAVCEWI